MFPNQIAETYKHNRQESPAHVAQQLAIPTIGIDVVNFACSTRYQLGRRLVSGLMMVLLLGLNTTGRSIFADDPLDSADAGPRYGEPQPIYFEIGMRIRSAGRSTGLTGSVPIPIDWPEQKITILRENNTDNLRDLSYKNLTREVRQMILKGNQLNAGEFAQGSVTIRADRRSIEQPAEPDQLVFAKKIPPAVNQYLKPSPFIESNDRRIRQAADSIPIESGNSAFEQVEQIYKWVRETVEYEFDTQIHSCLEALESGVGDCEELSSLFIAICRAKGIPARAVWIPSHTYPEFYLEDKAGNGYWLPCQAAGTYEFGAITEWRPILQKGDRFRIPGNPKPLRYVQPTLVAKDSDGGLSIEFISRQITDEAELQQLRQLDSENR